MVAGKKNYFIFLKRIINEEWARKFTTKKKPCTAKAVADNLFHDTGKHIILTKKSVILKWKEKN